MGRRERRREKYDTNEIFAMKIRIILSGGGRAASAEIGAAAEQVSIAPEERVGGRHGRGGGPPPPTAQEVRRTNNAGDVSKNGERMTDSRGSEAKWPTLGIGCGRVQRSGEKRRACQIDACFTADAIHMPL